MTTEGIETSSDNIMRKESGNNQKTNSSKFTVKAGMTVLETLNAQAEKEKIPVSNVLLIVDKCLEEELLPLASAAVNTKIVEIQTNPDCFGIVIPISFSTPPISSSSSSFSSTTSGKPSRSGIPSNLKGKNTLPTPTRLSFNNPPHSKYPTSNPSDTLSPAVTGYLQAIHPLLPLWLQLPQHRDMVVTVLGRSLSGFADAAREEMESISWKMEAAKVGTVE